MRFATQAVTAAAVVGVAVATSSAFTAGNTVPVTGVGQGASTTSGYVVSAVKYAFAASGDLISSVSFTLVPGDAAAGPANEVRVRLATAPGSAPHDSYSSCTPTVTTTPTTTVVCNGLAVPASLATVLDIVATSNKTG